MKKDLNEPTVFLDPLTEVGEALAARWNEIEGYQKYAYDEETATICSETGTGFHMATYLMDVLGLPRVRVGKGRVWSRWEMIRAIVRKAIWIKKRKMIYHFIKHMNKWLERMWIAERKREEELICQK